MCIACFANLLHQCIASIANLLHQCIASLANIYISAYASAIFTTAVFTKNQTVFQNFTLNFSVAWAFTLKRLTCIFTLILLPYALPWPLFMSSIGHASLIAALMLRVSCLQQWHSRKSSPRSFITLPKARLLVNPLTRTPYDQRTKQLTVPRLLPAHTANHQ